MILKVIRKSIDLKTAREIIGYCKKHKEKYICVFYHRAPWREAKESIEKTIYWAFDVSLDDIVVTINTPMSGSAHYDEVELYGTLDSTNMSYFYYLSPVFVLQRLVSKYLLKIQKMRYNLFYFRSKSFPHLFNVLISPTGMKHITAYFKAAKLLFGRQH